MTDNLKQRIAEAIFQTLYPFSWRVVKDRAPEENLGAEVAKCNECAQAVLDIVEPMISEWKELARKAWVQLEQVDCNNPLVDELFDVLSKDLPTTPTKE